MVTADGKDTVGHAGARVLCDLADELGLTEALSVAMAAPSSADGVMTVVR
jgi:hypothetical protein